MAGARINNDIQHVHQSEQDARQNPGREQRDRGLLRRHRVKDHRDRGRNDHRDRAGRRDQTDGELVVVAAVAQRRIDQTSNRSDGAHRGMGHRAEQFRGYDRGDRKRPARAPGQRRHPLDHAPGDTALPHDLARQNEKRNREQRNAVETAEHVGLQRRERHVGDEQNCDQGGRQQDEIDRKSDDEKYHRQNEIDESREHYSILQSCLNRQFRRPISTNCLGASPRRFQFVWRSSP